MLFEPTIELNASASNADVRCRGNQT